MTIRTGVLGAAAAVGVLPGCLALMHSEGNNASGDVAFVAVQLALAATFALVGSLGGRPLVRAACLALASSVLWAWAMLGVFSIGVFIVPAALLCVLAAAQAARPLGPGAPAATGAATILGAFAFAWLLVAVAP